MLHIKLREWSVAKIFGPYTHPRPAGWGQKVKLFFLKVVMLHIKLKGKERSVDEHARKNKR